MEGNLADVVEVAKLLAASGYFQDVKDMAQAVTKILAGRDIAGSAFLLHPLRLYCHYAKSRTPSSTIMSGVYLWVYEIHRWVYKIYRWVYEIYRKIVFYIFRYTKISPRIYSKAPSFSAIIPRL
jgi:hypothetical protein